MYTISNVLIGALPSVRTDKVKTDKVKSDYDPAAVLLELIRGEIASRGPISFARFMELALYHPGLGYYERSVGQIGRHGDYFTNVSVGSLFGDLLAFDFARRLTNLRSGKPVIVECGAHDGTLANDILTRLQIQQPGLYEKLQYVIVEPSHSRRRVQTRTLSRHSHKVTWRPTISEKNSSWINGVIFSNELLDSFPFHRLKWNASDCEWHEEGVGLENNRLVWVDLGPWRQARGSSFTDDNCNPAMGCSTILLETESAADFLPDGFRLDYCPAATRWWQTAARSLAVGALVTIDYGFTCEELLCTSRSGGTARAYHRHSVDDALLDLPGQKDITAHVDFSALIEQGEAEGLETEFFGPQELYIMRILRNTHESDPGFARWTDQQYRQLTTLVHPCQMGRVFRVLSQVRPC
ncbi:MAG: SAM-dependent methyltransferase [Verrucomicrobiae bacterium]|nr:SAM-dependent methyltransferase [Verrucomicrobiae bacterium]